MGNESHITVRIMLFHPSITQDVIKDCVEHHEGSKYLMSITTVGNESCITVHIMLFHPSLTQDVIKHFDVLPIRQSWF